MNRIGFLALVLAIASTASSESALSPRQRIRFDDAWRFRRDPISQAKDAGFQWAWKMAGEATLATATLPDDFEQGNWRATRAGRDVFSNRIGFVWYRAQLGSGPKPPGSSLHFDQVDDNAVVFLNGKRILRHEGWDEPFDVSLSGAWNASGGNTLAVLVENTAGPGGITGPVSFSKLGTANAGTPREASASYDDRAWRSLHLPHDYVVEGAFTRGEDVGHGSLPVTTAWYRKSFTLPASFKNRNVWIDFDGVYRNSIVYLNGHKLGTWADGYAGFRYGLNRYANFGGRNVLAVFVDPRKAEGWWYEGGGIYRHVWLNVANPIHVQPNSLFVQSTVQGSGSPDARAEIHAEAFLSNGTAASHGTETVFQVRDPNGRLVASTTPYAYLGATGQTVRANLIIRKPQLWSIEQPNLYTMTLTVYTVSGNGFPRRTSVDAVSNTFGIRTIRFDSDHGFFLNGKHVLLKGTCNHQDHAGVGVAVPDGLQEWRIRRLKEMGSNAYRCSHNPPAPELLDACDRLGMVVMDETRHFGDALGAKSPRGTKTDDLSELKSLVLRDRNHPSVIMWSLFNEEGLQGTEEGAKIFTAMRNAVRSLDPTRPCTGAMNGGWGQGVTLVEDLQGFNYGINSYDGIRARFPKLPMYGSETASTVSTRGIYENDSAKGYVSAYDLNKPGWGATAQESWSAIANRPWMAGEFVWTGFDYKGEPTPYGWPCINSHFGIMDMCGFPKDNFFYYQAWWGSKPIVHLLPHWNWKGKEGKSIEVWAYSAADEVELWLNGRSLGRKGMPRYGHVVWSVPYVSGALIARAFQNGKVVASHKIETTGAPAAIRLRTSVPRIPADLEEVSPIEVAIVDSKGRVVPTAGNQVSFTVSGPGTVVGVGNGDPSSHELDKATQRRAFNGLCMALVGRSARPGKVTLVATSPGLRTARLTITAYR